MVTFESSQNQFCAAAQHEVLIYPGAAVFSSRKKSIVLINSKSWMLSTSVGSSLLFHTKVNQQTKQAVYCPHPPRETYKLMLSGDSLAFLFWDYVKWVFYVGHMLGWLSKYKESVVYECHLLNCYRLELEGHLVRINWEALNLTPLSPLTVN